MNSLDMRLNPLFHRAGFDVDGFYELPKLERVNLADDNVRMIPFSKTKRSESGEYLSFGVHFFEDDYRFVGIYNNPERTLAKLSQYNFLCTPDYSAYSDMDIWRQIESIAHSRWVGAYWQSNGLTVIPTVSWSTEKSFSFCFDSIAIGSDIAVGTIGCKHSKREFLYGYDAMLERVSPNRILCVGSPFSEMRGNVIVVPDAFPRKAVV